jgi:hypothetical protein
VATDGTDDSDFKFKYLQKKLKTCDVNLLIFGLNLEKSIHQKFIELIKLTK